MRLQLQQQFGAGWSCAGLGENEMQMELLLWEPARGGDSAAGTAPSHPKPGGCSWAPQDLQGREGGGIRVLQTELHRVGLHRAAHELIPPLQN